MASKKIGIPKGTRDFSTIEMLKRNYIFDTIKNTFKIYGFQEIQTPAMENLSSLQGKYGEEGDKLMFKVLNSGDFISKVDEQTLNSGNSARIANKISDKGLRYDLTVPLARFVVQNRNDIALPFKRFQMQAVWRADRPQKGRYREFYQCDVDVIGSNSLLNELELVQIIDNVFKKLNINTIIKINNRKILSGIAEVINQSDKVIDITVAIDKLEKIGIEKVNEELLSKDIPEEAIEKIQPIILLEGSTNDKLKVLKEFLSNSEIGLKGVAELEKLFEYIKLADIQTETDLDLSLARGLNYYTGAIIEVKSKDVSIGSICGGGRYDNLTDIFGMPNVSGVGISFGADRIYDVLEQLNNFPSFYHAKTEVLFVNFGEKEEKFCIPILDQLRKNGVHAELYPDSAKMKKQMTYANKREIPVVAIVGSSEMQENKVVLKIMKTGEQKEVDADKVLDFFTNNN